MRKEVIVIAVGVVVSVVIVVASLVSSSRAGTGSVHAPVPTVQAVDG